MNSQITAFLLALLVSAVPSGVYGVVLAKRVGRSGWLGLLAGFCLPWLGLLFFMAGQPSGERRTGGAAKYSMVMLFVASLMVMISTFLVWMEGDAVVQGESAAGSAAPNDVAQLAIVVWLLAAVLLLAGLVTAFGGHMAWLLAITIFVSLLGGLIAAGASLYGATEALVIRLQTLSGEQLSGELRIAAGSWVAFVALVTAYWALILLPLGLKLKPYPAAPPPLMAAPPPAMPVRPAPAPERPLTW